MSFAATAEGLHVSIVWAVDFSKLASRGNTMNFDIVLPITLIIGIVYAIKVVVDAMLRRHIVNGGSVEVVNSVLRDEEQRRRHSSLRWGIVLLSVALGFGLIQWFGWKEITPGLIAVLAGATGLGNLVFFAIARRILKPE
jgi:hypothetical protein